MPPIVLAAVAHPDDIEFMMAGTLLLLKEAGAEIHFWNLARGDCGTVRHSRDEIIRIRQEEAEASAKIAGATYHPPLFNDLGIFYDQPSLAHVAAVVREIKPTIVLTHSPRDYMEDHENTCRLVTTAVFARGMPNFETSPTRETYDAPVAIYHAMPHGLRDGDRLLVLPDGYVDITSVFEQKRAMLAAHASQKEWLDVSQGLNAYLNDMENMSVEVGKMSHAFNLAEGWRRHLHLGFAKEDIHPLAELLGDHYFERQPWVAR